jgi:YidC/Oxa1 family membrane protein insertase
MNFDRNTTIGFVLLMVLLFGYIFVTNKQQAAYLAEKKQKDSLALVKAGGVKKISPITTPPSDTTRIISNVDTAASGSIVKTTNPENISVLENDLIKVCFTNKGGYPKSVELKLHKNFDGTPVVLGSAMNQFAYPVKSISGNVIESTDIDFLSDIKGNRTDSIQTIVFSANATSGNRIQHIFSIRKDDYLVDWNLIINGVPQIIPDQQVNLKWNITASQLEKDLKYEKGQSNIGYYENEEYNFDAAGTGDSRTYGSQTKWIGVKQQFFNTSIIAPNNFSEVRSEWTVPAEELDSLKQVMKVNTRFSFQTSGVSDITIPLKLYFGPNDYNILKKYGYHLENHVQLGYGIFAFVKYINRWVIMPVFDFLHNQVTSLGIVILLLTLFIRVIISPLTYTSYLSGAKMKVLRPELDEIKKKVGDDQQAFSMEQMKLFRQAGVNPLGGCIPALLQIPIFFALYSFFNAMLSLRGESFLWTTDLSGYDSIATLPFHIPWYGDHVSLFTITATLTSLLISVYNTQMTPQQDNPVFKYMIYIFPVMLLFIFNSLPSALTWYYTVSNVVTLLLQLVIQKFIINEEKIHAKIQENKKKPVTQSKWQQKLEQIQDTNKKLQDIQKKSSKK